jgi:DNA-binding LacI/PurR family transcriptional regulator
VAFVLAAPRERLFEDPNLAMLLDECTQALAAHDISLLVTFAGGQQGEAWVDGYLNRSRPDGVLVASICSGNAAIAGLLASGLPVIGCGKPIGYRGMDAYVTVDDRDGARHMVDYLGATGRRRIGMITGPLDTPGGVERLAGYREIVGRGDAKLIVNGDYTRLSGETAMQRLLEQAPDLDAVFVASDLMAAGALAALRRAGRRIPDDVAVGGFDDSHIAGPANLNLTTIRQPWSRISAEMVRLLVSLINGDSPSAVILPTELVARAST